MNISEVISRATQGRTQPYICRCDDGNVYFVKGRSVPKRELVSEWVAARLGRAVGVNVAPFDIADVPQELCAPSMGAWLADLGPGAAFASQRVMAQEFALEHRELVPADARALIVAFDWWVRNSDRTLTEKGGNPNLLWKPIGREEGEVIVFSWVQYPSKAVRDAANAKMRDDDRMKNAEMPFDGKRMIFGGFVPVVEE